MLGTSRPAVPTSTVSGRGARDLPGDGGEDARRVFPAQAGSICLNEPEFRAAARRRQVAEEAGSRRASTRLVCKSLTWRRHREDLRDSG